jgi:hypothetical protein
VVQSAALIGPDGASAELGQSQHKLGIEVMVLPTAFEMLARAGLTKKVECRPSAGTLSPKQHLMASILGSYLEETAENGRG